MQGGRLAYASAAEESRLQFDCLSFGDPLFHVADVGTNPCQQRISKLLLCKQEAVQEAPQTSSVTAHQLGAAEEGQLRRLCCPWCRPVAAWLVAESHGLRQAQRTVAGPGEPAGQPVSIQLILHSIQLNVAACCTGLLAQCSPEVTASPRFDSSDL